MTTEIHISQIKASTGSILFSQPNIDPLVELSLTEEERAYYDTLKDRWKPAFLSELCTEGFEGARSYIESRKMALEMLTQKHFARLDEVIRSL